MSEQGPDLGNMMELSAEDFAKLVVAADDPQIEEVVRRTGTQQVLDRIFQQFADRFRADKAGGVDADVQFVVTDEGQGYEYVVGIHSGACDTRQGKADNPKTTLSLALVPFVRLVAGQANGVQLFMTGKL